MNTFTLETIKLRTSHLALCLAEAKTAESMQDRLQWYMRALSGSPTPLDDLNQLIAAYELRRELPWTTTPPSQAGYYWLRNYRIEGVTGVKAEPTVVHLSSSFGEPFDVTFHGTDYLCSVGEIVEGEWCGPLQAPGFE